MPMSVHFSQKFFWTGTNTGNAQQGFGWCFHPDEFGVLGQAGCRTAYSAV